MAPESAARDILQAPTAPPAPPLPTPHSSPSSLHAPTTSIGLPAPSRAAGNSCCAGHPLRDPNWLLGSGFCRSRCWFGYHNRIGNRLRNIDGLAFDGEVATAVAQLLNRSSIQEACRAQRDATAW